MHQGFNEPENLSSAEARGCFKAPKLILGQTVNSDGKNAALGADPGWGAAPGPHRYMGFEAHASDDQQLLENPELRKPQWQSKESCWCCAIDVLGVFSGNTLFPPLSNHQADLGSAAGQKTIAREADNFKMNEILLQPALKKIKKGTFFFLSVTKCTYFLSNVVICLMLMRYICLPSILFPTGQSARLSNL